MKEMQVTAKPKFFATALIACAVIISTVTATTAQNWPSKLINLIVPFPPGGTSDVAARLISDKLSTALGQPVVIDNRAGVSGVLGTQFAAKASGDGYTLLLSSIGPFAFAPSTPNMTAYDPLGDFAQVAMLGSIPLVRTSWFGIAVPASTPREIVVRLNREINLQIQSSQLKARFNDLGFMTRSMTPDEVTRFIEDEITKWKPIVVATKVSFQ
jgi:tripartite-type tricarboxylate transporter receptor subunit TctC